MEQIEKKSGIPFPLIDFQKRCSAGPIDPLSFEDFVRVDGSVELCIRKICKHWRCDECDFVYNVFCIFVPVQFSNDYAHV